MVYDLAVAANYNSLSQNLQGGAAVTLIGPIFSTLILFLASKELQQLNVLGLTPSLDDSPNLVLPIELHIGCPSTH